MFRATDSPRYRIHDRFYGNDKDSGLINLTPSKKKEAERLFFDSPQETKDPHGYTTKQSKNSCQAQ